MGCSCLNDIGESITNQDSRIKIKEKCQEEYFSYLYFLYTLKGNFNSGQFKEKNSRNELNNSIIMTKKFYLIPLNWFEDWEERIKNILMKNVYRIFKSKFKYKNFKSKTKFYFKLMSEENWEKILKNEEYNLKEKYKTEIGLICNNLIIFQYKFELEEKNSIEIFFFEKDEDLFLTNLLFSFEKCDDAKFERNNFLKILKSSPIYEILGNMHYDQSKSEFMEEKKKIIIYNKTRIVSEEIKKFRKKQYELILESINNKEKEDIENGNANTNNVVIVNKETSLINYNQLSSKFNQDNKNESQAISRASTIMNANHQNLISNYSNNNNYVTNKVKIKKKDEIFMEEYKDFDENKNYKEIKLNDKLLLNNKLRTASKIIRGDNSEHFNNFNELEITEVVENKVNESFLISILYCLFNISYLRNFIHNNNDINIDSSRFYPTFANIMNNIYDKICSMNNSIDLNKINNINYNLIQNSEGYNFQRFYEIIKNISGKNLISKIINLLHNDINQKSKDYSPKQIDKNDKEPKYNEFINNIKSIHSSIIFDLFFGIKKVTKICKTCKKELETYKLFNVFNISLENISENIFAVESNGQSTKEELTFSIEKYLEYSFKEIKENQGIFKCPFCNNNSNYNKMKNICKYPDYSIFYLDNEFKEKFKINLDENLNILNKEFELFGIIIKIDNNEENKYLCYCQDIINKIWLKYEDENINKIDINEEKKDISYPIALFYQKIK